MIHTKDFSFNNYEISFWVIPIGISLLKAKTAHCMRIKRKMRLKRNCNVNSVQQTGWYKSSKSALRAGQLASNFGPAKNFSVYIFSERRHNVLWLNLFSVIKMNCLLYSDHWKGKYLSMNMIDEDSSVHQNILILFPCVCLCACPLWSFQFMVRVFTFLSLILYK